MRRIGVIAGVCLVALASYVLLFAFVAKKPISIGFPARLLELKRQYAEAAEGPRIIVASGSNGWHSLRCETIEPLVGRPCVNNSVFVALGRELIFRQALRLAKPGDIIVTAFEFRLYLPEADPAWAPVRRSFLMSYDRGLLATLAPRELVETLFSFDMRYLLSSAVEVVQWFAHARAQAWNMPFVNPQGDRIGHSRASSGEKYAATRDREASYAGQLAQLGADSAELREFGQLLQLARSRGVQVVGALPASIDEVPLADADIARLAGAYREGGQDFIVAEGKAQFPRDCFFDTPEHLLEECQIDNSRRLGEALAAWMRASAQQEGSVHD